MHAQSRILLRLLIVALLLAWSAVAAARGPEMIIKDTFDESLKALLENHESIAEDPRKAEELIDEILSPRVDFTLMSQLILGRNWRDASDEQRDRFVDAFQQHVIRTYSRVLSENIDDALALIEGEEDILRIDRVTEPDDRGRVTVRTTLRFTEMSVPVHYRLIQQDDDEWRAYDVVVENISFVTNYRQEFGSAVRRHGLDGLIERIEERNQHIADEDD